MESLANLLILERETGLEPEVIRFACSYSSYLVCFQRNWYPPSYLVLACTGGWLSRGYHGPRLKARFSR
jgi:hypothetical protein